MAVAHFAQAFVAGADDGNVGYVVVQAHQVFYFCGVAVEAPTYIHVFGAVGDFYVAGVIAPADITGVQPALVIKCRRSGVGVIEVAAHYRVTAYMYAPKFAGGQALAGIVCYFYLQAG